MGKDSTRLFNIIKNDIFKDDADSLVPKILFHFFRKRSAEKLDKERPLEVCLNGDDSSTSSYAEHLTEYFPDIIRFDDILSHRGQVPELSQQVVDFADEFSLADPEASDELKIQRAKQWSEENKGFLIIFDNDEGLDLDNPPDCLPLPKTHNDYFLISRSRYVHASEDSFEQFKIFCQLAVFRLILDEKSHFGESRTWESFFENSDILNLESWVDGSWAWDDEKIASVTSSIFGDAVGKLARRGKENEEIASFVRRTSTEVKNWKDVVPCFLTAFLSVQKLWSELGFLDPDYLLGKIQAEKKSLMERDSWPYSEKMGDFAEYLPEDTDFKEVVKNLKKYKDKYKKGYAEFEDLEKKERAILQKSNDQKTEEEGDSGNTQHMDLDLHLTFQMVPDSFSFEVYGVLLDKEFDQKDAFHFSLKEDRFWTSEILQHELKKFGTILLQANKIFAHGFNQWIYFQEVLKRLRSPICFLLDWKIAGHHRFQYSIQKSDTQIQVWNNFTFRIKENSQGSNTSNLDLLDQSSRFTKINKEISYQSQEHQYRICESNAAIRNNRGNLLNLFCESTFRDLDYFNSIEGFKSLAEKEVLRKLANFKKGEIISDPDAGRGHLLHWFAGHFSHKSETGFPRYIAVNEKANDFYQIAEFLLLGSLASKSVQSNLKEKSLSKRVGSDLVISDTSKVFACREAQTRLLKCYESLDQNGRGLFYVDLYLDKLKFHKVLKEIIADGSLKLVVKILDKADCYLLYIQRANPTKTVNFLHLQTAEEVKNFLRDESDPTRFTRPVEDLSTVSGYQFWQASRDDILKTKEIDLTPARWKPKELAHVISSGGAEAGLPQEFSQKIRLDIEKDFSLLDEIESMQTQIVSIILEEKKIEDLFEVHHAKDFYGKMDNLTEEEKNIINDSEFDGSCLYGTGLSRIRKILPPQILSVTNKNQFEVAGLALSLSEVSVRGIDKPYHSGKYFLEKPTVTNKYWSADRSIIAFVPKEEMNSLKLKYFKNWFEVVGQRFIFGLNEDFEGLVPLIEAQSIAFVEKEKDLENVNLLIAKLRNLYGRRTKQSHNAFRDHAKSIFDKINSKF